MAVDLGGTSRSRALRTLRRSDSADAIKRKREIEAENLRNALQPKFSISSGAKPQRSKPASLIDRARRVAGDDRIVDVGKYLVPPTVRKQIEATAGIARLGLRGIDAARQVPGKVKDAIDYIEESGQTHTKEKREAKRALELAQPEKAGFGSSLGASWDKVRLAGTQLGEIVVGLPPAAAMLGGAVVSDAARLTDQALGIRAAIPDRVERPLGRGLRAFGERAKDTWNDPNVTGIGISPKNSGLDKLAGAAAAPFGQDQYLLDDIARESVSSMVYDFQNLAERPGYVIADTLGILGGGWLAKIKAQQGLKAAREGKDAGLGLRDRTKGAFGEMLRPRDEYGLLERPGGKFEVEDVDDEGVPFTRIEEGTSLLAAKPYSRSPLRRELPVVGQRARVERLNRNLALNAEQGAPSRTPKYPQPETRGQRVHNALTTPVRRTQTAWDERMGPEAVFQREHRAEQRTDREIDVSLVAELSHLIGPVGKPKISRGLGAAISLIGDEGLDPETGRYVALDRADEIVDLEVEQRKASAEVAGERAEAAAKLQELRAERDVETDPALKKELAEEIRELRASLPGKTGEAADHLARVADYEAARPWLKKLAADHAEFERTGVDPSKEYRTFRLTKYLADHRSRALQRSGQVTPESATFREAVPHVLRRGEELTETVPFGPLRPGPVHPEGPEKQQRVEDEIAVLTEIEKRVGELRGQVGKSSSRTRARTEAEVEDHLGLLRDEFDELIRETFGDEKLGPSLGKADRIEQMRRNRNNAMLAYADAYESLIRRGFTKKEARVEMGKRRDPSTLSGDRKRRYEKVLRTKGELAALEDLGTRNLSGLAKARREGQKPTVKSELLAHYRREFEEAMDSEDTPTAKRYRELSEQITDLETRLRTVRNRKRGRPDDHDEEAVELERAERAFEEAFPLPGETPDADLAVDALRALYAETQNAGAAIFRYTEQTGNRPTPAQVREAFPSMERPDVVETPEDAAVLAERRRDPEKDEAAEAAYAKARAQRERDEAVSSAAREQLKAEMGREKLWNEYLNLANRDTPMDKTMHARYDELMAMHKAGQIGPPDKAGQIERPLPAPLASGKTPELHPDQATLGETIAAKGKRVMPRRLSQKELAEVLGEIGEDADPKLLNQLAYMEGLKSKLERSWERRTAKTPIEVAGTQVRPQGAYQAVLPRETTERRRDVIQAPMGRDAAQQKLAVALDAIRMTPAEAGIRGVAGSAIDSDMGGAAFRRGDGTILATHLTDDPIGVARALSNGDAVDTTRADGLVGDLGSSGLYVSDVPDAWVGRSQGKWGFLDDLTDEQGLALTERLSKEIIDAGSSGYITGHEAARALDSIERFQDAIRTGDDKRRAASAYLVPLADQPFNISFWRRESLEPLGIKAGKAPEKVPVEIRGTFVEVERTLPEGAVEQLKAAGFDGAYMKGGMAGTPQLVVWNNGAVRKFGDVELNPIEKPPGTFYTGIFTQQAGGTGEYRPSGQTRKPRPKISDPNARHAVTDRTIKFGKRRVDAPHMTVELGYKAVRTLAALRAHDELWQVSSQLRQSEYDIPILESGRWPRDLQDLERVGDRNLPVDPASLNEQGPAAMDAIARHIHGADPLGEGAGIRLADGRELQLWQEAREGEGIGSWKSAVPVGEGSDLTKHGVRWIDRRLIASYRGGPEGNKVADAINNPLRTLYVYGRLAYILNLPGNMGMQVLHQGFAAPRLYKTALEYRQRAEASGQLSPEEVDQLVAGVDAVIGEGKARATAVPTGPQGLAGLYSNQLAWWWSSWIDRFSRRSALFYEMERYGVDLNDFRAQHTFVTKPGTTRSIVARRGNKAMVEFNNMTDYEKNTLRHWIFLYPWMSRATVWAFRESLEHPLKMWALEQLSEVAVSRAKEGDDAWWDELPSYLRDRGFWKYGQNLVNFQGVNTYSTAAESVALMMALVNDPASVYQREPQEALSPWASSLIQALTGEDGRGREAEHGFLWDAIAGITRSLPVPATFMQRSGVQVSDAIPGPAGELGDFLFTPDENVATKPWQGRSFAEKGVGQAAGGFSLGGLFPREPEWDTVAAKAERERRLGLTVRQRTLEDLQKERAQLESAGQQAGIQVSDPVYATAFQRRAARHLAYVGASERLGVPLSAIGVPQRFVLDVQLLVQAGVLDSSTADQMLQFWLAQPASKLTVFRTNLHAGIGGEGALTGLRRSFRNVTEGNSG